VWEGFTKLNLKTMWVTASTAAQSLCTLNLITHSLQPGGPVNCICNPPPGVGWPSYTPRHWVPILVIAIYDLYGLQWIYSFPWSPHKKQQEKMDEYIKIIKNSTVMLLLFDGDLRATLMPWYNVKC
jgi:hypothetical protein